MNSIVLLFSVFFLSNSYGIEIPHNEIIIKGDLAYDLNTNTLFSGTSTEYHTNGKLKEKTTYREGKWVGLSEIFYKNGQLEYQSNYKNGLLNGSTTGFYESGEIKYKGGYQDGNGFEDSFYKSGQL